jgi:hypothetical protein
MESTSNVTRWEYKIVMLGPSTSQSSEALLNSLGEEGWNLVAFQPNNQRAYLGEGAYYLKRPR